jgi:hypothetical protein
MASSGTCNQAYRKIECPRLTNKWETECRYHALSRSAFQTSPENVFRGDTIFQYVHSTFVHGSGCLLGVLFQLCPSGWAGARRASSIWVGTIAIVHTPLLEIEHLAYCVYIYV